MEEYDLFISYSSKEYPIAKKVSDILESNDISCWMAPENIALRSNNASEIAEIITRCKAFLVIISENAQISQWVPKEIGLAITNDKFIFPLIIDNYPLSKEFEFYFSNLHLFFVNEINQKSLEPLIRSYKTLFARNTNFILNDPDTFNISNIKNQTEEDEPLNTYFISLLKEIYKNSLDFRKAIYEKTDNERVNEVLYRLNANLIKLYQFSETALLTTPRIYKKGINIINAFNNFLEIYGKFMENFENPILKKSLGNEATKRFRLFLDLNLTYLTT